MGLLNKNPYSRAGLGLLIAGDTAAAGSLYAWAIAEIGAEGVRRIGATDALRDLAQRGPNADVANRILRRYWPGSQVGSPDR